MKKFLMSFLCIVTPFLGVFSQQINHLANNLTNCDIKIQVHEIDLQNDCKVTSTNYIIPGQTIHWLIPRQIAHSCIYVTVNGGRCNDYLTLSPYVEQECCEPCTLPSLPLQGVFSSGGCCATEASWKQGGSGDPCDPNELFIT